MKINGQAATTSGCHGSVTLNMSHAHVAVGVGHVRLFTERRWGKHAAPGYLMNVRLELSKRAKHSGGIATICGVETASNNRISQLAPSEALFDDDDFKVPHHTLSWLHHCPCTTTHAHQLTRPSHLVRSRACSHS